MTPQMPGSDLRIEPLGSRHDRAAFSCGVAALDRYLQQNASQDRANRIAAIFVCTPHGVSIAGYYTLSAHVVRLDDLPRELAKKLPRYPNVPATLLGRLAVSNDYRRRGIGQLLLVDSFRRVLLQTREIASAMIVVDAKDDAAREFYLHHDFIALPSHPNRLIYSVRTIEKLFAR